MIAISGAGGKSGRAVVAALRARGESVRGLVRSQSQAAALAALGAEPLLGDIRSRADLDSLLRGGRAYYHICPNMAEDESEIGARAIAAAQNAGIAHFIFHSVLHPQTEEMPHHWAKLRVEALLFKSGLPFTILQPAAYMQNVGAGRAAILGEGLYAAPYAAATRIGMVDLEDIAEVAARVLTSDGHLGALYELANGEWLSQTEVAAALSLAVGRPVHFRETSRAEWEESARRAGLAEYAVQTLLKMFAYYERWGFGGSATVLRSLLGREPARFADFALREFGSAPQ